MNNFENNQLNNLTDISADITPEKLAVETSPTVTTVANEVSAADGDVFRLVLKKPAYFNGKEITEVTFDWGSLTGVDSQKISAELRARSIFYVSAKFSEEFKTLFASRVSNPRVGEDFILSLPINEYLKINEAAQSFLIRGE